MRIFLFLVLFVFTENSVAETTGHFSPDYDNVESLIIPGGPADTAQPTIYIQPTGPLSFCPGGSVTLTVTGAGVGATYLWNTGQTTKSITVTTPGLYSVKVRKKNINYFPNPVTVSYSTLKTDFDFSGVVDVGDYMILLGNFNSPCSGCPTDLTLDGITNVQDYLMWVADIFKTCQ